MRLETDRLLLVACGLELADALQADRGRAAEILDAALPEGWPDEELAELLPIADTVTPGFGVWIAVQRHRLRCRLEAMRARPAWPSNRGVLRVAVGLETETDPKAGRVVVGSAGFQGDPQDGAVELGYGIHPSYRDSGYATEAASALVEWALAQDGVRWVTAECERSNAASAHPREGGPGTKRRARHSPAVVVDQQEGLAARRHSARFAKPS